MEKAELASAIASFTRALECTRGQAEVNANLYFHRANAFFCQGSWAEAGEDARSGLALCDDSLEPASKTVLSLKPQLTDIARNSKVYEALEQAGK